MGTSRTGCQQPLRRAGSFIHPLSKARGISRDWDSGVEKSFKERSLLALSSRGFFWGPEPPTGVCNHPPTPRGPAGGGGGARGTHFGGCKFWDPKFSGDSHLHAGNKPPSGHSAWPPPPGVSQDPSTHLLPPGHQTFQKKIWSPPFAQRQKGYERWSYFSKLWSERVVLGKGWHGWAQKKKSSKDVIVEDEVVGISCSLFGRFATPRIWEMNRQNQTKMDKNHIKKRFHKGWWKKKDLCGPADCVYPCFPGERNWRERKCKCPHSKKAIDKAIITETIFQIFLVSSNKFQKIKR